MASTVPESLTVTVFCDYVDQFSGATRVSVMIDRNRLIGVREVRIGITG